MKGAAEEKLIPSKLARIVETLKLGGDGITSYSRYGRYGSENWAVVWIQGCRWPIQTNDVIGRFLSVQYNKFLAFSRFNNSSHGFQKLELTVRIVKIISRKSGRIYYINSLGL